MSSSLHQVLIPTSSFTSPFRLSICIYVSLEPWVSTLNLLPISPFPIHLHWYNEWGYYSVIQQQQQQPLYSSAILIFSKSLLLLALLKEEWYLLLLYRKFTYTPIDKLKLIAILSTYNFCIFDVILYVNEKTLRIDGFTTVLYWVYYTEFTLHRKLSELVLLYKISAVKYCTPS